jgi:hypothetical protein
VRNRPGLAFLSSRFTMLIAAVALWNHRPLIDNAAFASNDRRVQEFHRGLTIILLVISRCFDLLPEHVREPILFSSIVAVIVHPSSSMAVGTSWSTATSTSTLSSLLHVILVTSLLMLLSCQAGRLRPWWESHVYPSVHVLLIACKQNVGM